MIISISYWFFGTILAFTPLAFGTSELWSMTYSQAFILCGFTCYLLALAADKRKKWQHPPGLLPLLLICFYILCQLIRLPPWAISFLSPHTAKIYSDTIWLVNPAQWMPLTLSPKATLLEFYRLSTCVVFYIFTIQLLANRTYLSRTITLVAILAPTIALVAIIQKFTSPNAIYWLRTISEGSPMGPWVNRNHFAGFMEMALPLLITMFLYYRPKVKYKNSWRQKISLFFAMPESNFHILLGFGAILVGLSIFLSLSRSGITGMCLSLMLLIFFLENKNYGAKNLLFILTLALAVILGVCWFGWQPIIERFGKIVNDDLQIIDGRPTVWLDSLEIIYNFPLFGIGFGSFLTIYPAYRSLPGHSIFDHAHNDYIELLTDGGLIASLLLFCFFLSLLQAVRHIVRKRRDPYAQMLSYGVFCSIFALLIHSFTDFNFHNGANAFYFFFYCGLLVSVSSTRRFPKPRNKYLPESRSRWTPFFFIPAVILLGFSLYHQTGMLKGQFIFSKIPADIKSIDPKELKSTHTLLNAAIDNDTWEPNYRFASGMMHHYSQENEAAKNNFFAATSLAPLDCRNLQWLGFMSDDLHITDQLYSNSARYNPTKVQCIRNYLDRLIYQHNHPEVINVLRKTLSINPNDIKYYFNYLDQAEILDDKISEILPEKVSPFLQYAEYLWDNNKKIKALNIYLKGLTLIDSEAQMNHHYFRLGYKWSMELGRSNQAFEILKKAVLLLPDIPEFHELLGDFFLGREIAYRAVEEYEKALSLDPYNRRVKDKLLSMSKIENP
ncbi:MAG: O-antigen ligase family protein [Desulfobulbaceae bacterium]|nr:O-antigen ligase family protein [Desulfobulbaceae bacterium]